MIASRFTSFRSLGSSQISLVLTGLAILLISGCGYTQGGVYRADVNSIHIPIFTNKTFYREFEFAMTEATIKAIESRTPYKVMQSDLAQTEINATLVKINQVKLSRTPLSPFGTVPPTDLPLEMELQATVDLTWRKRDKTLLDRKGVIITARYRPAQPYAERLEEGKQALAQATADRILTMMLNEW